MQHSTREFLALILVTLVTSGCAHAPTDPILQPSFTAPEHTFSAQDLRAARWTKTSMAPNVKGVVQHRGDDALPGGIPNYLWSHLQATLEGKGVKHVALKTADWRIAIPDLNVPVLGPNTMRIDQIHHALTAQSSASAVLCISVDGVDYLGHHAHIFRSGSEQEAIVALSQALTVLRANIQRGHPTDSPACQPAWEGGQPPLEDASSP